MKNIYTDTFDKIGLNEDGKDNIRKIIEDTASTTNNKSNNWIKWGTIAACICLIAFGAVTILPGRKSIDHELMQSAGNDSKMQQWSESMTADDYFKNNCDNKSMGNTSSSSSFPSLAVPPYSFAVSLDDGREKLEKDGVLPEMPDYTEHSFQAEYNEDGTLYKVWFMWMRRSESGLEEYSDLTLIAAPKEVHEISDTVSVPTDENGDILPENVTLTERDGVTIIAKGSENEEKTITWQTKQGWYQITGSWNDSYEDMVELLDWFWSHPLELSRFDGIDLQN
ncbi:MAG: hypothetical protein IJT91_08565 [Clostridia bacterium]|nr:hypothetical protein [Clostridia bacterium]